MTLLLILFLASGGAMVGMSIPLIRYKVPPNHWYGFRVPQTLANPDVWYAVNAYSAWRFLWLGVGMMLVAVVAYFVPGLDIAWYGSVVGIVVAIGLLVSIVQCFRYLGQQARDTK